jgi:hypothetical protein
VWLFVTIALVMACFCGGAGLAVLLVRQEVSRTRVVALNMQCSNNLKQIALAMHNYHDVHKCFPAAYVADKDGKPLHSWRVALLPYLEQAPLYDQYNFNEPWDSPNNMLIAQQMPDIFRCPDCPIAAGGNMTNYVVVVGDPSVSPAQSMFMPNHWTKMSEITDGTSNTIMVVEASDAAAVIWTKPDDFVPNADNPLQGLLGTRPGGFIALFCDGSVRFMAASVDRSVLKALFTAGGGEALGDY